MAEKRAAILSRPRYGIRPDGADHIDILVSPLRNAGIRSVAFHPEWCDFPDTKLDLLARVETPHLLVRPGTLNGLQLQLQQAVLFNSTHSDTAVLHSLLEFILIDMLYKIIVEGKELRKPAKKKGGEKSEVPKTVAIRPHYHPLQPGHQASPTALEAAKKALKLKSLPPGVTFVRAHYRGNPDGLEYNLPNEPIGIYSDQDLFEGVK